MRCEKKVKVSQTLVIFLYKTYERGIDYYRFKLNINLSVIST
jgi:hypothetical protein